MSTAALLSERRRQRGCRALQRDAILTVVMDEHNAHALTEDLLDTWWHELDPELKAEIYDAALGGHDDPPPAPCFFCDPSSPFRDRVRTVEIFQEEFAQLLKNAFDFQKRPVQ